MARIVRHRADMVGGPSGSHATPTRAHHRAGRTRIANRLPEVGLSRRVSRAASAPVGVIEAGPSRQRSASGDAGCDPYGLRRFAACQRAGLGGCCVRAASAERCGDGPHVVPWASAEHRVAWCRAARGCDEGRGQRGDRGAPGGPCRGASVRAEDTHRLDVGVCPEARHRGDASGTGMVGMGSGARWVGPSSSSWGAVCTGAASCAVRGRGVCGCAGGPGRCAAGVPWRCGRIFTGDVPTGGWSSLMGLRDVTSGTDLSVRRAAMTSRRCPDPGNGPPFGRAVSLAGSSPVRCAATVGVT